MQNTDAALASIISPFLTVTERANSLVKVLRSLEGNENYQGIWRHLQETGYNYDGPSFGDELNLLEDALKALRYESLAEVGIDYTHSE
jgi:hypothetical protein